MNMTIHNHKSGRAARAFTLVELLTVMAIIGVVASLVVAGIGSVTYKKEEAAVKVMHAKLVSALEDYKKAYGSYPPDNAIVASNTPYWNPLAYELGGVRRTNANFIAELDPTHTITTAGPAQVNAYFGVAGFVNASANAGSKPKSFLTGGGSGQNATFVALTNGTPGMPAVLLLQVPAQHPTGSVNVWRYRAYPVGGKNPKTFDLWCEYRKRGGGTNILGNWK